MHGESTPRSEIIEEQILYYRRRAAEYDATSDWRVEVFFANWLSHVLPADLERFWAIVRTSLGPGGRVFFVDEAQDVSWRREEPTDVPHVVTRRLRDGSSHRAVKIFWAPQELEGKLNELGWDVSVTATPALLFGHGRPAAS